jgi:class 3 adenylate cyclase
LETAKLNLMRIEATAASEQHEAEEWIRIAREAEQRGDLLTAYDLAARGVTQHPEDVALRYRAVLNLARSGANDRAAALFAEYGLAAHDDERIASLGARILREEALRVQSPGLILEAAQGYERVYQRTQATFPGINAASLYLIGGDQDAAKRLASKVLASCSEGPIDRYDRAADAAAAALIVGDTTAAVAFVGVCRQLHGDNYIAVAATRRQLTQICRTLHIDPAVVVSELAPRTVIHFTGHLISPLGMPGPFPAEAQPQVAHHIADYLERHNVGYGFGSLACGADILFAEALLARRAELSVVLPFAIEEFRSYSVTRGGPDWEGRFETCLAKAASVTYATDDEYLGDRVLLSHASRLAMGLALLRAEYLDAAVAQISVWDGRVKSQEAGTEVDILYWREKNLPSHIIGSLPSDANEPISIPLAVSSARPSRSVKAMLFGDAKGFSKLRERQIPAFIEHFLGAIGRVLERYAERIEFRNTWGDGLYLVMSDPVSAMHCALDLQTEVAKIDRAATGLPADLGLRIGGHAGPVFRMTDPILGKTNFMGSHVSRTARMEPITPEGQVYVTEAFAALIALERDPTLTCEYVGVVPAAKDYGSFRMHLLKRRDQR